MECLSLLPTQNPLHQCKRNLFLSFGQEFLRVSLVFIRAANFHVGIINANILKEVTRPPSISGLDFVILFLLV